MDVRVLRAATRATLAAAALLLCAPAAVEAQQQATAAQPALPTGRIVGRVVDAQTGAPVTDAGVQIVGTTLGTTSGVDGRFTVPNVPAGTVTLQVRRIGYQAKSVTGLMLGAGQTLQQDVSLPAATVQLQAVSVTAAAERGTVNEALDRQRTATGIVNAVTSEQIAKSPDSDAAQAVQRVSGVNVQDGRYVVVRGLGERYTTSSLNGARMPSPEPERRVVPLDLFPSALLQSVATTKTFTPDQPGDFSGASVDIQTREFPADRVVSYSASMGYNDAATGRTVLAAPTTGGEWLARVNGRRDLPAGLAQAGTLLNAGRSDVNAFVGSFRNAWSARPATGAPNLSLTTTVGGNDPILGRRIGYVGSLTYSATQEVRADEERGLAIANTSGNGTQYTSRFRGETGRGSVLWGGVLNLSTLLGSSKLSFNNTYNRTADNEARRDFGFDENINANLERTTLRYVERSIRVNQLRGDHAFGGRATLDWQLTSAGVGRREPDRSDLVYIEGEDGARTLFLRSAEAARRTFGDLDEQSLSGGGNLQLNLGNPARQHYVKVGALFRDIGRDASNQSYSVTGGLPLDELRRPAEEIFDGRHSRPESQVFSLLAITSGGSYATQDRVGSGYVMAQAGLSDRVRLVGGLRLESWRLRMRVENTDGALTDVLRDNADLLPALALNVQLGERQNLRLSASQTLARPEYRELAPITYLDIIGGEAVKGNADLRRTLIRNADLRWELYPSSGELLSVALFGKRFDEPIERVQIGTSGTSLVSFANARHALNYGVELEARKGLGGVAGFLAPVTLFSNATLMRSRVTLDTTGLASVENAERAMVGQAPYVVNAGLTYTSGSGRASATVLYNVVGKRIYSASAQGLPDVYEYPRDVVDLSLRFPLAATLAGKLDLRNLLDAPYLLEQGDVVRERYRVGRIVSLGLSWQP